MAELGGCVQAVADLGEFVQVRQRNALSSFGTGKVRYFKFCMLINHGKYYRKAPAKSRHSPDQKRF